VSFGCAAGVPSIQKFLATRPGMKATDLLSYFWERVAADVLPNLNRTLYVWVEGTLTRKSPCLVVHTCRSSLHMTEIRMTERLWWSLQWVFCR
jgi:hypothetical protein